MREETWRNALATNCMHVDESISRETDHEELEQLTKPVRVLNKQFLEQDVDMSVDGLAVMVMKQYIQLERLHQQLTEELVRVNLRCELEKREQGPTTAASALLYQKDDIARKLGSCLKFTSKAEYKPDMDKLRQAWLEYVVDKFQNIQKSMMKRHEFERQALRAKHDLTTDKYSQKEMMRKRYLRMCPPLHTR